MDFTPTAFLYDFCLMSVLLVTAKIIRAKVRFFQNLYIPSALLAGLIGVIGGKYGLNLLPFSPSASQYAGLLIAVLFATMYLGKQGKQSFREMFAQVGDTFLLNAASEVGQFGITLLLGALALPLLFPQLISYFALMMPAGFAGGHGTAAAIGNVLGDAGWEEATTVGQTFATFGLLFGIFGGVLLINFCARRGETRVVKEIKQMPEDFRSGLINKENRLPMGENTVSPMSIDPLTWHLSIVLVAVGVAYLVNSWIAKLFPSISIPIYGLALLAGGLIQKALKFLRLDDYVDRRVISRVGSSATDYLVAFGVATININVVLKYWQPIVAMCLAGIAYVTLYFFFVSRKLFRTYKVERGIYIFGWSTGVMSIAVLLLRIVDPEFESGVLEDSGFAWIFVSLVDIACVTFTPILMIQGWGLAAGIVMTLTAAACILLCRILYTVKAGGESEKSV